MTPEEKFLFDLQGYIHLRQVLNAQEVDELNAIADERALTTPSDSGERTSPNALTWGAAYLNLIDHPRVLPYLAELIESRFRLDHDYVISMRQGASRGPLHGGVYGMSDWWYACHNGVIRNGLFVVTYCLTPAAAGENGFVCIPGSHKSAFIAAIPPEVRQFERTAPYVIQPEVEAGDAILFTEALIHGTAPWRGRHERRVVLLKYGPGHCASSANYYDMAALPTATDRQKQILAPPSLYNRPEVSLQ